MDLRLLDLAAAGEQDSCYTLLVECVVEGDDLMRYPKNHCLHDFKRYAKDLSLFETASGPLIVYQFVRIVIPKSMRTEMVEALHKFHFSGSAMIKTAEGHFWWPGINANLISKWSNCL